MNFIITSEHRVGSRWLHYLLAELYDKKVSPEIDVNRLSQDAVRKVRNYFKSNKIPKFHRATPQNILDHIKPHNYKVIAVVRNPRDRAVSFAFHNRYHNRGDYPEKALKTDLDAVKYMVYKSRKFKSGNDRIFKTMVLGHSTKTFTKDCEFIWTTYKWMKEDINKEITAIINFLNQQPTRNIRKTITKHSFNKKANREVGDEKRSDLWRRKGIQGDWENWFDDGMINVTEEIDTIYWNIVREEESFGT
jgi:hypothetical protein